MEEERVDKQKRSYDVWLSDWGQAIYSEPVEMEAPDDNEEEENINQMSPLRNEMRPQSAKHADLQNPGEVGDTGEGAGGRHYIQYMDEQQGGYPQQISSSMKIQPGSYMPYPPPPAAYGGTGYEQPLRRDYGSKRPVSAVAGRKTRGALLNNYSRGNNELSRTRPKHMLQDRESLYDEARILKHQINRIKDQNIKLHTKIQILENDIGKKDKILEEFIVQQSGQIARSGRMKPEVGLVNLQQQQIHLITALKRQIKELRGQVNLKEQEVQTLKKNTKATKLQELEIEMKMYIDECTRLRHLLEETMRAKNPLGDPQEVAALQEQFRAFSMDNKMLAKENRELGQKLEIKSQNCLQLALKLDTAEKQLKKKDSKESKEKDKTKKALKDKEREVSKLKQELQFYKHEVESKGTVAINAPQGSGGAPGKVEKLMQEQSELMNENADLKNEIKDLKRDLVEKNVEHRQQEKAILDLSKMLEEKVNELHSKNQDGGKDLETAQKQNEILESRLRETVQAREDLENEIRQMKENQKQMIEVQQQQEEEKQEAKKETIVSPLEIEPSLYMVRLLCQSNSVSREKAALFILHDYSALPKVSIGALKKDLESMDIYSDDALKLARFIIEPRRDSKLEVDLDRWMSLKEVVSKLERLIGDYRVYSPEDEKILKGKLLEKLGTSQISLREAFELYDRDQMGYISHDSLEEVFQQVDILLDREMLDFIIYLMFMETHRVSELKYQALFTALEEASAAMEEEHQSEPPDDYQQDVFQDEHAAAAAAAPAKVSSDSLQQARPDVLDQEEEPAQQGMRRMVASEQLEEKKESQPSEQEEEAQEQQGEEAEEEYSESDPLDQLTQEQVMDYAEQGFYKFSGYLRKHRLTVRQFLEQVINAEQIDQDEEVEYIKPTDFIDVMRDQKVGLNEEFELTCLLKVIMKAEFGGVILLQELIQLLSKFGVPQRYKGGLQMNYEDLDHKSVKYLTRLTEALMEQRMSLYQFFKGAIYQQMVKTKSKQKEVDLINADDFFEVLCKKSLKKSPKQHLNLMQFLCLDSNYVDRIYIKKLGKAVAQFAQNQEFRAIGHMKESELENAEANASESKPDYQASEEKEDSSSKRRSLEQGVADEQYKESMSSGKHYDESEIRDPLQGQQSEYASEHQEQNKSRVLTQNAPPALPSEPQRINATGYKVSQKPEEEDIKMVAPPAAAAEVGEEEDIDENYEQEDFVEAGAPRDEPRNETNGRRLVRVEQKGEEKEESEGGGYQQPLKEEVKSEEPEYAEEDFDVTQEISNNDVEDNNKPPQKDVWDEEPAPRKKESQEQKEEMPSQEIEEDFQM